MQEDIYLGLYALAQKAEDASEYIDDNLDAVIDVVAKSVETFSTMLLNFAEGLRSEADRQADNDLSERSAKRGTDRDTQSEESQQVWDECQRWIYNDLENFRNRVKDYQRKPPVRNDNPKDKNE